jgi:hypothetical protein
MWKRKPTLVKRIERMMIEEEMELHFLESQSERAYHTGVIDGLGQALFAISPKKAKRNPLTIVWFTEDEPTQTIERQRERVIEIQHSNDVHMSDLFESAECD